MLPCSFGWRFDPRLTSQVGRPGVQNGLIFLYEIESGKVTMVQKIRKKILKYNILIFFVEKCPNYGLV